MKKDLLQFLESIKNSPEKVVKKKMKIVLRSYDIQCSTNQSIDNLEAFKNSLFHPTRGLSKKQKDKLLQIKESEKRQKSPRFNRLYMYEDKLIFWKSNNMGNIKIASLLWQIHRCKISRETLRIWFLSNSIKEKVAIKKEELKRYKDIK